MIKKIMLVVTGLLLFVLSLNIAARISDEEWTKYSNFIEEFYKESSECQQNPTARSQALENIAFADHPQLAKLLAEKLIPYELRLNDLVLLDAITKVIPRIKDKEAVAQLRQSVWEVPVPTRAILIMGMAQINQPEVIKQLTKLVEAKEPEIQTVAMNALTVSLPPDAITDVIKALDSKEWEVRAGAVNYLNNLKDAESQKLALEALKNRLGKETAGYSLTFIGLYLLFPS